MSRSHNCKNHFIEIRVKDIENSHLDDYNTNVLDLIESININRQLLLEFTRTKGLLESDDFFIRNKKKTTYDKDNTSPSLAVYPVLIKNCEGLYSLLFLDTDMEPRFEFVIIQTDNDFVVSERVNQGEEMLYDRKNLKKYIMREERRHDSA